MIATRTLLYRFIEFEPEGRWPGGHVSKSFQGRLSSDLRMHAALMARALVTVFNHWH